MVAVAILTVVLLLGNSEETTLSEPESSAEVAPAVITRIDLNTKNIKLKPGDIQRLLSILIMESLKYFHTNPTTAFLFLLTVQTQELLLEIEIKKNALLLLPYEWTGPVRQ